MKRIVIYFLLFISPISAIADVVVPTRTLRANTLISDADVTLQAGTLRSGFEYIADVVGQETRATLYAGRPIRLNDIGPPALVERNQIVSIKFQSDGLVIMTEGRSLQRGGIGDRIRIMNLSSRTTLFGQVQPDGTVRVFQ